MLDELPDDAWTIFDGDGFHWQRGFPVPKMLLDAECVVQTCNLKTHRYGGHFTLSLKNSVGLVAKHYGAYNYMTELHGTDDQRRMIAEINTAYQPALIVLDGVEAFVTGGPATGSGRPPRSCWPAPTVWPWTRWASRSCGCSARPRGQPGQSLRAGTDRPGSRAGAGRGSPEKISFVTGDAASATYAAKIMQVLHA